MEGVAEPGAVEEVARSPRCILSKHWFECLLHCRGDAVQPRQPLRHLVPEPSLFHSWCHRSLLSVRALSCFRHARQRRAQVVPEQDDAGLHSRSKKTALACRRKALPRVDTCGLEATSTWSATSTECGAAPSY